MKILSTRQNETCDKNMIDLARECAERMVSDYYENKAFENDMSMSGVKILDPYLDYRMDEYMVTMCVPIQGPNGTYNQEVDLEDEGDGWYAPMLYYDWGLFNDLMEESEYWKDFKKILSWK